MNTIQQLHGISLPNVYDSGFGSGKVSLPNLVFGLELEIEEFDPEIPRDFPGINYTSDGSLRNSEDGIGIEAITWPIKAKHIESFLREFFDYYRIEKYNYSERCSTHVHMNVLELTYSQLASLCVIYQTVESLLFTYVGEERENNIFCVPWNQCGLSYKIIEKVAEYDGLKTWPFKAWQKYSSLNLLPLVEQGSIEFRHLGGTCNIKKIMGWINLLSQMYKYSVSHSFNEIKTQILHMNTVSNYREWLEGIFEEYADLLRREGFEKQLSSGVVDSKLALLKDNPKTSELKGRIDAYLLEQMINANGGRNIDYEFTQENPVNTEPEF